MVRSQWDPRGDPVRCTGTSIGGKKPSHEGLRDRSPMAALVGLSGIASGVEERTWNSLRELHFRYFVNPMVHEVSYPFHDMDPETTEEPATGISSAKKAVLQTLKRSPGASLKEAREAFGISRSIALKHLAQLEAEGLVERAFRHGGMRRPPVCFRLPASAQRVSPSHTPRLPSARWPSSRSIGERARSFRCSRSLRPNSDRSTPATPREEPRRPGQ